MIPHLRAWYNEAFTEQKYEHFLRRLDYRLRAKIGFRISETPCFVPRSVQRECEEAAVALTLQAHSPELLKLSDATLRPDITVGNQPERSTFITVDFAMTSGPDGSIKPRLIEMQGFPSLMGFQLNFAELVQEHFAIPSELSYINGGHTRSEYLDVLHRAIIADEDPENVILLEVDPWGQKTSPDFHAMHDLLGIDVVDIRSVKKIGRVLHYEKNGSLVPIRRIFNRAIVDELERSGIDIPFNWNDDLDVSWAGHPNWYFRISKFVLPYLDHPTVPKAIFLDRIETLPEDLDNYVLKPLYSFAGVGVVVGPTREEIEAIPLERRGGYILQERIVYLDAIQTPVGGTKAELRFMMVWLPGEEKPRAISGLTRTGRGKLMGVDFNKNLTWIGAGCNFFEPA